MDEIRPVETAREWEVFIDLPWKIYESDPHWVPPLKSALRETLDVSRNLFFKHAFGRAFIAYRDGQPIGRILGFIDESHNRSHKETTAFFGFYDLVDDPKISAALFETVQRWAKQRGMTSLVGPVNLNTGEQGLLLEKAGGLPYFMTAYNPPYYANLLDRAGFTKSFDLWAYRLEGQTAKLPEKSLAQAERVKEGGLVTLRSINFRKLDSEAERLAEICAESRLNPEELIQRFQKYRRFLDPKLVVMAENQGKPAAVAAAIPDLNMALKKISDGEFLPFGWAKLLWNLKGPRHHHRVDRCSVLTLCIKKTYRELGLTPFLCAELLRRCTSAGYQFGETLISEKNSETASMLVEMGAERTQVYRIYQRPIT